MDNPLLHYNQETDRWEGEDGGRRVKMDNETFLSYVMVWVRIRMRTKTPTQEQMKLGVLHCRRMNYWIGCEWNYDNRVKVESGKDLRSGLFQSNAFN